MKAQRIENELRIIGAEVVKNKMMIDGVMMLNRGLLRYIAKRTEDPFAAYEEIALYCEEVLNTASEAAGGPDAAQVENARKAIRGLIRELVKPV